MIHALLLLQLLGAPQEGAGLQGTPRTIDSAWGHVAYWPGDSVAALRITALVDRAPPFPGLQNDLPRDIRILLAPSESVFDSLLGGNVPEWGAGVAIPAEGTIVLPLYPSRSGPPMTTATVLRHELAHLALHQAVQGHRVPRWFTEGYAEWASGGWRPGDAWKLRVAFVTGAAPPLDSLVLSWPRSRASAELAYLLSATAVEYLERESGVLGLERFIQRMNETGRFESALRRTYGVTTGQFEEDWKKYVRRRYGWLLMFSQSVAFWAVLTAGMVSMFWVRRRHNREQLARLRASDIPEILDETQWNAVTGVVVDWQPIGEVQPPAVRSRDEPAIDAVYLADLEED